MTIRHRCMAAIFGSLVFSTALNVAVLGMAVFPTFIRLEHEAAHSDLNRVIAAIEAQIADIATINTDYSTWDDSYRFALGEHRTYVRDNLYPSGIQNIAMNLISIRDRAGRMIYEAGYEAGAEDAGPAGPLALARIDPRQELLATADDAGRSGLVMTGRGPLLVAARPILPSSGEGPYAGTFVMGRLLNANLVAQLNALTEVPFELLAVPGQQHDAPVQAALDALLAGGTVFIDDDIAPGRLAVFGLLRDLDGAPALLIRATARREVSQTGWITLLWAVAGIILAGVIVMAVTLALLQALLVGPVRQLTRHLLAVGDSGNLSCRLASQRKDEIGTLSREFDGMLEKLAEARNRLLDQSYSAGIADMASGVLHNIRNQMAPLSLRLQRLQESLGRTAASKLMDAIAELNAPGAEEDSGRKQKILRFLALSCQQARDRHAAAVDELKSMADDFVRVEHVLRDLDRFSRRRMSVCAVNLNDVVGETVAMLPKYPDIEVIIRTDPKMGCCPRVVSEPFVLKHVLHNLLVNAIESMIASGKARGTIHLRVLEGRHHGRPCIDLQIQDEGLGIPPDKLETIFARGFSTKTGTTRRGAGLHWCANSMLALGGRIFAESPGPQQGATLHLIVPLAPPEIKAPEIKGPEIKVPEIKGPTIKAIA